METNTMEYKPIGVKEIYNNGWKSVDLYGVDAECFLADLSIGTKCSLVCKTSDGRTVEADFTYIGSCHFA